LTLVDLLAEFQAEKVAHRDLKPENILLTKLGFKLTDFGLAKVETSRRSNSYAGSPFYVSPKLREAVEKEDFSNLDHDVYKSDVFSLGLNILEAASLCDVRSLNSMKSMKLIEEIIQRLAKAYDRWFIRLLRKMLEFDEEKRPDFVQLKEMVNLEMKESKRYNPFLDPNFQEVYQQDVYSYIKESVEKFGGNVAQQEKERMEKVQVNYENIIVKKQNNNLNANNETKENEKAGDIFDEVVRKTEKRKKNQNNKQLKEDLEYTKKINPPKFHEPIILQEHKVFFFSFQKIIEKYIKL
jgi:serine/threonine protein kinase